MLSSALASISTSRILDMSKASEGWRSVRLIDAGTWLSGGTPFTEEPKLTGMVIYLG